MKSATFFTALAVLSTATCSVSAHSIFQKIHVNGVDQGQLTGLRVPDYNGPITDVTSTDIICNGGPNPITHWSNVVIPAPAGASITTEWHHNLNSAGQTGGDEPIATSHKGPVISYLAKVDDALTCDVTGLQWFKIYEDGLDSAGKWGVDRLIENGGKVTFNLPTCIPPGDYLLRHEIIALHSASSYPGAQFYMGCAQLEITGGGSASPATVSFPGAYRSNDPGVTVNIYTGLTDYTIPGPPVFSC